MNTNDIKVNIIVCGKFHFHKFIKYLYEKGVLNQFIYSYKIFYDFKIPRKIAKNFPLKEYIMYAGKKILPRYFYYKYLSFLHGLWQIQVLTLKPNARIGHFLLHGNCIKIINKYKRYGKIVIGEVVNVHPLMQAEILKREYKKYNLTYRSGEINFQEKIITELNTCDYLLVPSKLIKISLIENGIDEQKIKINPYAIETKSLKKKSSYYITSDQTINLLCIALITFRKGTVYLLRALELFAAKNIAVKLTLVGSMDPLYENIVLPYINEYNVTIISHISNEEVPSYMCGFDLFILPSIEDGFGLVVPEALAVNLPVIVTSSSGASELIQNRVNGFIIEPYSEVAIFDAVSNSINNRFDMELNPIPTWNDYTVKLIDIYSELIN